MYWVWFFSSSFFCSVCLPTRSRTRDARGNRCCCCCLFFLKFFISFILFAHIDGQKRECAAIRWFIYICAFFCVQTFLLFFATNARLSTADRILRNTMHVHCSHLLSLLTPQSSTNLSFHIYESSPYIMYMCWIFLSVAFISTICDFFHTNDHYVNRRSVNSES